MAKHNSGIFGRVRLSTSVIGMVIGGIFFSVAAIMVTMFVTLSASVQTTTEKQVQDTMRLATTIFQINMPGMDITADDAGRVQKLVLRAMPRLRNTDMVDQIAGAAQEVVTFFSYDAETAVFSRMSTSVQADTGAAVPTEAPVEAAVAANAPKLASVTVSDEPARDATPLDPQGDVYKTLLAGQPIEQSEMINGVPRQGFYMPVVNATDATVGAIFVGVDKTGVQAGVNQTMFSLAAICAAVLLIGGILALVLSRALIRPIPRLTAVMSQLASGELETDVPYVGHSNEIGTMAKAVEVFRANALHIGVLNDEQQAGTEHRQMERAEMMQNLQHAFGTVVHAAVDGDFSQRITARFADAELNTLAAGVNELVHSVDAGLTATAVVLSHLAEADLSARVDGKFPGAFGKLQADTNAVAEKLADIVGQLKATSGSLKTASTEILSGANDLSERTTRQAATIEETSATMEQLAAAVIDSARKAEAASTNARTVSVTAEAGGTVMGQANEAMERIIASSSKISNIIGLIDDIAFQTNLLALNASVEAARAGDAGKGFAVVAVEVRRLAQSAASASAEVKVLIDQSAREVQGGSRLVSDAAAKLADMLGAVRQNSAALDTIVQASRQQAASIDEVNTAVRQMDEMTQHNAALVEEINAAIEQSEQQASELDRIVEIFVTEPVAANAGRRRAA